MTLGSALTGPGRPDEQAGGADRRPSRRARRYDIVRIAGTNRPLVAGLDIGGTKTLGVVAGSTGSIVASVRRSTTTGSGDQVLSSTLDTLHDLADAVGVAVDGFDAVGIGIPGLVDVNEGTVRHAVNLGLRSEPLLLAERLGEKVSAPVHVDNDVNAAAIGAAAALGCTDLAYLSVGTGIAAGLLLGGRLRRGAHGAAGEVGHISVDPQGPRCHCGQRGCLEVLASGPAIARQWPAGADAPSVAAALLDAAARGDRTAMAVRDALAGHLADAIARLALTVDPDLVVLGGGVADAGREALVEAVSGALSARADEAPVLASMNLPRRVALVPAGVPAGALGAALAARRQLIRRLGSADVAPFEVLEAM
jgi:glucokinase